MLVKALAAALVALVALVPAAAPATLEGPSLAATGRWLAPFDGEVPAVSMSVLPDGRVLYWDGVEVEGEQDLDFTFFLTYPHRAESRVWDPATGLVTTPNDSTGAGSDLFCAGHAILPDGRVLAAGGTDWTSIPQAGAWDILYGSYDARVFNPATNDWERVADMGHGRWYPSVLTLPSGDALAASGIATLTSPDTMQRAYEVYDAEADDWSDAGERLLPMYPRLIPVPSGPLKGELFYTTAGALWGPFGAHPMEAQWSVQQAYDPATGETRFLTPSAFGARQHAASVLLMLDPAQGHRARVLTFGGTLQRSAAAVPFAEVADLGGEGGLPVSNRVVAPMAEGRWHLNGVLLPDGGVLAVGGGRYDNVIFHGQPNLPVLTTERYDPATGTWATLATMGVPRMYHSTAVLLPDGRVLAGGHVPLPVPLKAARDNEALSGTPFSQAQVQERRLELFEPPYLFRGPRPVLAQAPSEVAYGETFAVTLGGAAADVTSAVLIRLGSTTHSYDSGQRGIGLALGGASGSQLTLAAPPDADVAPPGHYMLFVGTGSGDTYVPSVARIVRLA